MKINLIYITNPNKKVAKKIAQHLLQKRLVACVNIFPINSLYWWEGSIAKEKEFVLIAKTVPKNFEKVIKEVEKLHPYSIPCILRISANSNKKFFEWLKNEIKD